MSSIVSFNNVSKDFPGFGKSKGRTVRAVDSVTLDIAAGTITGVIGYSGAGKSTLVRLINALELPSSGSVVVDGRDITRLNERQLRQARADIGMVFQQFNLFNSRSVARNVEYPLKLAGWPRDKRAARVKELLEFVGIADKVTQFPSQLSGGQKQRVGIARALATSPKILLADEATSALDPETTTEVLTLLKRINEELGTTVVVITHEMNVVRSICHQVAVMEDGRVLEHGPVYNVFAHAKEPATKRFISSTIHDRPTLETVARLQEVHPGRMVTVTISEEPTEDAAAASSLSGRSTAQKDIADIFKDSPVHSAVVYGSITEIAQRPYGSLTYVLSGTDDDVDRLVSRLKDVTAVEEWPVAAKGATR